MGSRFTTSLFVLILIVQGPCFASSLGDLNKDNIVDMNDLGIFVSHWLQSNCNDSNGCGGADLDDSNQVDFLDYALLAQNWATSSLSFIISGTTGVDGVTMSGLPGDPCTSGGGLYTAAVPYGWSGTVTPTMARYRFSPSSVSYTNVTSDLPNQNFTACRYSDGFGTSEDPYQIANVADWQTLMTTSADWDKYFVLTAGINLQDIEITPVGDSNQNFIGSLDGASHIIRNAFINRPDYDYVGLFGYVGNGSNIHNLGLESANITGRDYVGGLIGRSDYGSVNNCYVTGSVSGNYCEGGLIGLNAGSISNCYVTNSVNGGSDSNYIGGLIGNNSGDVNYCYATGLVSGGSNVGGLVGFNDGAVDNSFWDIQTSGQTTSAGGTGKTTAEMKTLVTFTSAGWDFSNTDGDPADWKMLENITYPRLFWENTLIAVAASDAPEWFKSGASYICDGISDQVQINAALTSNRDVILSSGTFNISAMVAIWLCNNIILEGQGPSTIIRNTSSVPCHPIWQGGPNHDITIRNLQIDNNDYGDPADAWNKCLFINGDGATVLGSDGCRYLCLKAHIANSDNRPVTGPNFETYWSPIQSSGFSQTWVEGESYTGIDSCNNILIEGITAHDSKAEVICVDYAEHIIIRDCNSYNGAWSGITVAHTRYSTIYNNQIRHCGESVACGDAMSRGINIIGSSHVSVHDNWIRDCIAGGIGVNETYGRVESVGINIYDNHIIDTIGGPGIIIQSSNDSSNTYDVNIWGNYVDTYREVKLDAGGVAVDNGGGTVTLPATYNGFRETLSVKIIGTINYNGNFTLKKGTDDDHLVISHAYFAEQFNGTETVSQSKNYDSWYYIWSTDGMYFHNVINFNVRNNTIEPGTNWCYVKSTARDGLVEDNMYTANAPYVNLSPSTLFINNTEIPP